jgi:hypothetical protein
VFKIRLRFKDYIDWESQSNSNKCKIIIIIITGGI